MTTVARVVLVLLALLAAAQLRIHLVEIGGIDTGSCDYPDECLTTYLPSIWRTLRILWVVTAVAGLGALVTQLATRNRGRAVVSSVVALAATASSALLFLASPEVDRGRGYSPALRRDALFDLSTTYWVATSLVGLSALAFAASSAVSHGPSARRPGARQPPIRATRASPGQSGPRSSRSHRTVSNPPPSCTS